MQKLILIMLFCVTQTVGATAELTFSPLKSTYHVGECVVLKLQENLQAASRFHRVDLWAAVELPSGAFLFMTPLVFASYSPKAQFFRESLEKTQREHDILDFEVLEGLSGPYTFYAAYVEEGKNPITDDDGVYRSNLAQVSTTLSDEPPLIPVVDCISVLPAPKSPVAEAGDTSVVLSWEPVTGADSYVISWQTSTSLVKFPVKTISVRDATSYSHDDLVNGQEYSYFVIALDTEGVEGVSSTTVTAIPKVGLTAPPAPKVLSAKAGDGQVVFTWKEVKEAVSYTVYWQKAGGAVESRSVSGTKFTHRGLLNGISYTYWVKAVNATGLPSRSSGSITATPQAVVPPPAIEPEASPSPAPSSYRYTDNGNGTVTDNRSGLIWLKDANCFGKMNWYAAMERAANLLNGRCGLSDGSTPGMWRLPTKDEWEAMIDTSYRSPTLSNAAGTAQWTEGDAFLDVEMDYYWSSTAANTASAWGMTLNYGSEINGEKSFSFYMWPVRDEHSPVVESLPSPAPSSYRYTDNGDGTVTDNRSGLIWLKNANCFGRQNWETAMESAANLAHGQCGLSEGSTAGMWRLPTIDEWKAMVDKSIKYPGPTISNAAGTGKWTEGDAFLGVQTSSYWSSTPWVRDPYYVWHVGFATGGVGNDDGKYNTNYVWPVRRRH
ncbi:MAG TPA: DUF1566 domain-containing protein [Thiotrichaceae bacterium]|nr:DUF1566 domain-containing protein [Thiotrichaceae bacterium]